MPPAVPFRFPRLLALILGLASATGFAPLALWPVMLAALAGWMELVRRAATLRQALLLGWLFGLGQFALGLNWIQKAFTYQDKMPHWLGYLAPVLLSLYLAVFPAVAAGLAWRHGRRDRLAFVLLLAAAWIVVELLRARLFTGFPWNPLAAIWLPVLEMARATRWIGTYGLSGLTILLAGAVWLAAHRRWHAAGLVAAGLAVVALSGLQRTADRTGPGRVVIVQPNIDQKAYPDARRAREILEVFERLSGPPAGSPRLILWPEGAIRYSLEDGYPAYAYDLAPARQVRGRLAQLLGRDDILLTGADALIFDAAGNLTAARNSVFALGADGRIKGRYDKAHLVPYGEYLPARPLLEPIGLARLVPGSIDFLPGPQAANLVLPGFGPAGIQICYEIVFSGEVTDPRRRPAFLFNPSNDSWFGRWGPPQHLAQARLRAIEEGLPVLRSTPTGISALIAPDGGVIAAVPAGRRGAIAASLPRPDAPTLFARHGNVLPWGVALLLGLIGVALRLRRRYGT